MVLLVKYIYQSQANKVQRLSRHWSQAISVNAPEVVHDPRATPLEVPLSTAPEHDHDPRATPLEVPLSTAPEHDHEPRDYPPEIAPGEFLEAIEGASSLGPSNENGTANKPKRNIGWKWIIFVGFLVSAVGIGGGTGGSVAYKKQCVSLECDTYEGRYLTLPFFY